jgi:hypothetical protein
VVRLGDANVPSTIERRRRLEALGADAIHGQEVKLLEGLFLPGVNNAISGSLEHPPVRRP